LSFKLLTGLVLGVISIAVMLAAWRLSSGVIFDTRSVVLSMGTLFYGTIPGLVAGAIAAVYRASRSRSGELAPARTLDAVHGLVGAGEQLIDLFELRMVGHHGAEADREVVVTAEFRAFAA
jgi:hypothetical protein